MRAKEAIRDGQMRRGEENRKKMGICIRLADFLLLLLLVLLLRAPLLMMNQGYNALSPTCRLLIQHICWVPKIQRTHLVGKWKHGQMLQSASLSIATCFMWSKWSVLYHSLNNVHMTLQNSVTFTLYSSANSEVCSPLCSQKYIPLPSPDAIFWQWNNVCIIPIAAPDAVGKRYHSRNTAIKWRAIRIRRTEGRGKKIQQKQGMLMTLSLWCQRF